MIALVSTADALRHGDHVLAGADIPRWLQIEEIEEVILEGVRKKRVWVGRRYYELALDEKVIIGSPY